MQNILSLLHHVFIAICFAVALFLLLLGFDKTNVLFQTASDTNTISVINRQNVFEKSVSISYKDIISMFLSGLEQDIVINGIPYNKDLSEYYVQEGINIPNTTYEKEFTYDEEGNIESILFTSIFWK